MGDTPADRPLRVAVVGCGVAGLGAAYGLRKHAQLTLYESRSQLGGHANTVMVSTRADWRRGRRSVRRHPAAAGPPRNTDATPPLPPARTARGGARARLRRAG